MCKREVCKDVIPSKANNEKENKLYLLTTRHNVVILLLLLLFLLYFPRISRGRIFVWRPGWAVINPRRTIQPKHLSTKRITSQNLGTLQTQKGGTFYRISVIVAPIFEFKK